MKTLKTNLADGVEYVNDDQVKPCKECVKGKMVLKAFLASQIKSCSILQLLHVDLCGPFQVPTWNNARYMLTIVDDLSRKIFVRFLVSKDQTLSVFEKFMIFIENQTDCQIEKIRSDNGTEFCSKDFAQMLELKGIKHERTIRYTPQQNGVVQRAQRSIVSKVRCMMPSVTRECGQRLQIPQYTCSRGHLIKL